MALPSVGAAWAKTVPVMSPLVSGRKATEKVQPAPGASAAHGGSVRTNWRGSLSERLRDFVVRFVDEELPGEAERGGRGGAVVGLRGEDLKAGVFGGVGSGERDGVGGLRAARGGTDHGNRKRPGCSCVGGEEGDRDGAGGSGKECGAGCGGLEAGGGCGSGDLEVVEAGVREGDGLLCRDGVGNVAEDECGGIERESGIG